MKTFINVAQMKLASLTAGQFVETGGYYVKGDAGAARYLIVAAQAFDGYADHELVNGTIAVLQSSGVYLSAAFGINGATNAAPALQALANLGGKAIIEDGILSIESQVNLTVNNTSWILSPNAVIRNHTNNTGNVLSIQATGVEIAGGLIDGNNLPAKLGSAGEDGTLVSVTANSSFSLHNVKLGNVLGNNSTGLTKQALLAISNDSVIFEISDCDFFDCYILDAGGASQDAKFISFKGNTATIATRGRISGGSMIGVGTLLTSGVTADKDGKCIRGYYEHSVGGDQNFDIEITGVYSTQYDEAFIKMTGMKGLNIHHNTTVGIFVNPWDSVVVQPAYFVRNVMSGQTSGISSITNNTVSGIFKKLIEVSETTEISNNTFSVQNSGADNLDVIYEIGGAGVDIHSNTYELQTINRIFSISTTASFSRWSREAFGFVLDGDEGGGLGRRLIYNVADFNDFEIDGINLTINVQNATSPTDIMLLNAQTTNANITNLSFNDFNVTTNYHFNHMPRVLGTASVIDSVSYNNVKIKYNTPVTLTAQVSYETLVTHPKNISLNGFEIEINGLSATSIYAILNLDEMFVSTLNGVKISDKAPSAFTTGFAIQIRGDAGSPTDGLDISNVTLQNLKAGPSRCIDITNASNLRIEDVTFLNTVNAAGSVTGIQLTACDDVIIGKLSANDTALSSWTNFVKINTGDNYVVGSINCRGTKTSFGTATNVIDNT